MAGYDFSAKVDSLKQEVAKLMGEANAEAIEETATRLEGLRFTVPVITPMAQFLRLDKQGLLAEFDRIGAMDAAEACAAAPGDEGRCDDLRLQHMTVLLFYYRKLMALRAGSPEEWDEIDELFVHD